MIGLDFGKETRSQGIRAAFCIAMGIATWFVLQTGYIPAIGISAAITTVVAGLVLLKIQKVLGILPCTGLLPLRLVKFMIDKPHGKWCQVIPYRQFANF